MIEFLSLKKDSFGIEITDTNLRMMKLVRNGRIEVLVAGIAALDEGVIEDETVKDEKNGRENQKVSGQNFQ